MIFPLFFPFSLVGGLRKCALIREIDFQHDPIATVDPMLENGLVVMLSKKVTPDLQKAKTRFLIERQVVDTRITCPNTNLFISLPLTKIERVAREPFAISTSLSFFFHGNVFHLHDGGGLREQMHHSAGLSLFVEHKQMTFCQILLDQFY